MKRYLVPLLVLTAGLGFCRRAHAQAVAGSFDACAQLPKLSAPINIASATDTQLVAAQPNNNIFVCGYALNQVNGTGSYAFEYGTGANCATGKTSLMGAIVASTVTPGVTNTIGPIQSLSGTQLVVPAGNALCGISTGAVQQSGWVTYVQGPFPNTASFFDPCNQYQKLSARFAFSSATTTAIVTPASTSPYPTYICNLVLEDTGRTGGANTTTFEYGSQTSTACDTGATALTGPYTGVATTGTPSFLGPAESSGTDFVVPAGKQLCAVTTQTSPVNGYVTYVTGR